MSHFTTIKIEIKNGQILDLVLRELGYQVEYHSKVRGYRGDRAQAEYVIRQDNGYDLGFRRHGEYYELVADFWGAKINRQHFLNCILQKYARKTLMQSIQEEGFALEEEEEVLEDGTLRIVVGKWVR
jgi:hypothetical protein